MIIAPPMRVTRCSTQHYTAPASTVSPLLCPVRECDWIPEWKPHAVLSNSGYAELDCTFVTGTGSERAVWTTTRYDIEKGVIEFVRFGPDPVVSRIAIRVVPIDDTACSVELHYKHTALSDEGEAAIAAFGEADFRAFSDRWQRRLQHYLDTGRMLTEMPAGQGRLPEHPAAACPPAQPTSLLRSAGSRSLSGVSRTAEVSPEPSSA